MAKWWEEWEFPVLPLHALSQTGLVALVDGAPACAAWLYRSDSSICWVSFPICSKGVPKKTRNQALDFMFMGLAELAASLGFSIIFTSSKRPALSHRLNRLGFIACDYGVTHHMRIIECQTEEHH